MIQHVTFTCTRHGHVSSTHKQRFIVCLQRSLYVNTALLSVNTALLSVNKALLSVNRALLSVNRALLSVKRALLSVNRALLSVQRRHVHLHTSRTSQQHTQTTLHCICIALLFLSTLHFCLLVRLCGVLIVHLTFTHSGHVRGAHEQGFIVFF